MAVHYVQVYNVLPTSVEGHIINWQTEENKFGDVICKHVS